MGFGNEVMKDKMLKGVDVEGEGEREEEEEVEVEVEEG